MNPTPTPHPGGNEDGSAGSDLRDALIMAGQIFPSRSTLETTHREYNPFAPEIYAEHGDSHSDWHFDNYSDSTTINPIPPQHTDSHTDGHNDKHEDHS